MRRPLARTAGACALALATAAFTGTALAGGGHGGGTSGDNAQQSHQTSSDSGAKSSGQSTHSDKSGSGAGVKPSKSTDHWTNSTVGATPDTSKRYGNGKTAAEIAKGRGAPDNQPLKGPGNSQPHKTYDCAHKTNHSGGVDVHAIKSYSSSGCQSKQVEQKQTEQSHKITICHATGSTTNPYVLITVDVHSLENGHTAAKGDIIPAPAGGCPSSTSAQENAQTVTFCDMTSATTGKLETKSVEKLLGHELNGTPEEARDIVPPFTVNGQTYSQLWDTNGQATFTAGCNAPQANAAVAAAAKTVTTEQASTVTTTVTNAETTTVQAQNAAQTQAQTASSGGVLGAQATLTKPKSPSHGGVLGTIAGTTLPFTGFPLWVAVLIALAFIAAGIALSRRAAAGRQ